MAKLLDLGHGECSPTPSPITRNRSFDGWDAPEIRCKLAGEPGPYQSFDLAPDDTRLVFSRGEGAHASLWMLDVAARGHFTSDLWSLLVL